MIWTPASRRTKLLCLPVSLLLACTMAMADPPKLILLTENDGLLNGNFCEFYQYFQREFEVHLCHPLHPCQSVFVCKPYISLSNIHNTLFSTATQSIHYPH